jgi:hypothetical protein
LGNSKVRTVQGNHRLSIVYAMFSVDVFQTVLQQPEPFTLAVVSEAFDVL